MNIEQYLDELIKREGGVNNPADRGGAPSMELLEEVVSCRMDSKVICEINFDVAKVIYRKNYWTAPRFDQVNAVSPAAEELLDTGVNCGLALQNHFYNAL